jgi:hypothetical protein
MFAETPESRPRKLGILGRNMKIPLLQAMSMTLMVNDKLKTFTFLIRSKITEYAGRISHRNTQAIRTQKLWMETLQAGFHSGSPLSVSRLLHLANAPFSRMLTVFEKLTVAYFVKKSPAPKEPSKVHYYCMDLTLNEIHLV